jgi:hypothetical protein
MIETETIIDSIGISIRVKNIIINKNVGQKIKD